MGDSAREWFDEHADFFVAFDHSIPFFRERLDLFLQEATDVMTRLAPSSAPVCLDLGCGPGILARLLADLGFHVTGVDFSAAMLERARALNAKDFPAIGTCRFVQADVNEFMGRFEGRVSLVVSSSLLEYLSYPEGLFARVAEKLSPGGRFVVSIPNHASALRTAEGVMHWCVPRTANYRDQWGNRLSHKGALRIAQAHGLTFLRSHYFGLSFLVEPIGIPAELISRSSAFRRFSRSRFGGMMTVLVFERLE
jgi:SAM-dependent methyltransferase